MSYDCYVMQKKLCVLPLETSLRPKFKYFKNTRIKTTNYKSQKLKLKMTNFFQELKTRLILLFYSLNQYYLISANYMVTFSISANC